MNLERLYCQILAESRSFMSREGEYYGSVVCADEAVSSYLMEPEAKRFGGINAFTRAV